MDAPASRRRLLTVLTLAVLAVGCGGGAGTQRSPTDGPSAGRTPVQPLLTEHPTGTVRTGGGTGASDDAGAGDELRGTLGGDPSLEGGCVWVEAEDGQRYELAPAEGAPFTVDPARTTVVDPSGAVIAQAGDAIVVEGELGAELASFCQVGPIWSATDVRAD